MRKLFVIASFLFTVTSNAQIIRANSYYKPVTASAPSFSPKDVAGCVLWLYADTIGLSDNDPVSTWTDLSGNSNNATQSSTARPTYKKAVQNGRAVLRFDGSNDFMEVANSSIVGGGTGMTIFIVVKQATLALNKVVLCKWDYNTQGTFAVQTSDASTDETMMYTADNCGDDGSDHQNSIDADLTTDFYVLEYVFDGTQSINADKVKIYRNGTLLSTSTTGTLTSTLTSCSANLLIGKFGGVVTGREFNGDMGEIAIYISALGSTDRTNIRNYLKSHWGL